VALLLELARVLALEPRPYTVWLAFFDGDALDVAARAPRLGSRAFADQLAADGELDRIRLAVFFDQVADADLAIARDLRSHRSYREAFFETAARLGHASAFPRSAGYASPRAGHEGLLDRGLRPVVAIADDRFGGPTPPGRHAHSEADDLDHCSPTSLETVGEVSLAALRVIEERLVRIDRFAAAPLADDPDVGSFPLMVPKPEVPDEAPDPEASEGSEVEPGESAAGPVSAELDSAQPAPTRPSRKGAPVAQLPSPPES
jgi:hypothetical protein